jgi:integrase
MSLTETQVKALRPDARPYKRFDERGLFMLVTPTGGRLWRFKYRLHGVEKLLALGAYPDVSLKRAREKREEARSHVADGVDPGDLRKAEKQSRGNTFKSLAEEWLAKQGDLAPITVQKARWVLGFLYRDLGSKPIAKIGAPELLRSLQKIEATGANETATRAKMRFGQVARYAIATGRAERDITFDLRGALAPVVVKSHPTLTDPARVGELMRAIDGYVGQPATAAALKLAPLVFLRPGELRGADWSEIDLEKAEWRVPAVRMKMGALHLVPLARQAVAILEELQPLTGPRGLVFPSLRSPLRPISNNTLNAALRRLGYSGEEIVAHGFRAMASTLLNEQGWAPDVIELQLAHQERNKVRAAYNRATRLEERRRMMQAWADYLDGLKAGDGKIVSIKRPSAA